jgi:hypothetical protein
MFAAKVIVKDCSILISLLIYLSMTTLALFHRAQEIVSNCANELLSYCESILGWEKLSKNCEIHTYRKRTSNGVYMLRVECEVKANPAKVIQLLVDNDRKKEWDESYIEGHVVADLGPGMRILYNKFSAPWPVSNRDFVFAVKHFEINGKTVFAGKSIELAEMPPNGKAVRGTMHASGFIVEPLGVDMTKLVYFVNVDPMGCVPHFIVNRMTYLQTRSFYQLVNLLENDL